MPYNANVYQVLIASPSDVEDERKAITETIHAWNAKNSRNLKTVLMPIKWETHSTPKMEGRPQAIINKQLVEPSDILVGVFWTRIGTDTGVSESGTVEEIIEFIKAKKTVLLYFSSKPIPQTSDNSQYLKVKAFKKEIIDNRLGLFESFSMASDLQDKLDRHLTTVVCEFEKNSNLSKEKVVLFSKDEQVSKIKNDLIGLMDTCKAEWIAERDSGPVNIVEGKRILKDFGEELLRIRQQLNPIVQDNQSINRLDKLLKLTKAIQNYQVYIDGGISFGKFWKEGDSIFPEANYAIKNIR